MQSTLINIDLLKENPDNPRTITDPKFQALIKSVKEFPKMLEVRPIAFKSGYIVLGGNMRLRACKEAGLKEVPAIDLSGFTEEQQREFIIKDNVGYGAWDWEAIQADWPEAEEWGLDIPGFDLDSNGLGTDFSLPDGDKAPFQQMTFTLADEQAVVIQNAIDDIKGTDEYKYAETMGNENSNGNALYLIVAQWAEQRK
jgi:hypothetical protein